MDARARRALIKNLKLSSRGWRMKLPREAGMLLGKQIGIEIRSSLTFGKKSRMTDAHRRFFDMVKEHAPERLAELESRFVDEPPLIASETTLVQTILENLPELIAKAEKALWEKGDLAMLDEEDRIANPHIRIDREAKADSKAARWTMIVEVAKSDFAWYIEFAGTKFTGIWSGD